MRKILILVVVVGLIGVLGVGKVEAQGEGLRLRAETLQQKEVRNECRLFEGLKKYEDVVKNFPIVFLQSYLETFEKRYTTLRGNFQVVMREIGVMEGRGVEEIRQASYGVIVHNITRYVENSAEKATLMKVAAVEMESMGKNRPEDDIKIDALSALLFIYGEGGYGDNLDFATGILKFLFSQEWGVKAKSAGKSYYPDTKKELIRALALGDFGAVDRLVNREEIHKARDLWKSTCNRAIEMQGGRK